jgi:AcrR family transcriptional regulator
MSALPARKPTETAAKAASPKLTTAKEPSRRRGQARVEMLLEGAAAVFAEKGFDAAAMTQIAERAGASVGSLYQFFPTKESLADVLRARYGDAICARWDALTESPDEGWTAEDLAACLFRITTETLQEHPSFVALMVVRDKAGVNVEKVRKRYQDSLSRLLRSRLPDRSPLELRASLIVVRQLLRCEIDLELDPDRQEREAVREEFEALLANYLASRMKPR